MMYLQLIVLLFSLKVMCLQPSAIVEALIRTVESDRLALVEFKRLIDDPLATLSSWNDSNVCNWHGVSCGHRHKRVAALYLVGLKLRGPVTPHIGNLTFLRRIDLANNSFFGEIPPQVGFLFRLQYLYLMNNTFSGEIPAQLSNCSRLKIIDFRGNKLVGKIPPQIGSLAKLVGLQLGVNNFTGSIPPSIGNLSSLELLAVAYNQIEGTIPDDIGHLKSLSILAVGANRLSGMLPTSLYNISSITVISTASNKLNGTLPADIGLRLPKLQWLAISINEFSGPVPVSLSNASKLQILVISRNNFVGVFPRDLGKLSDLRALGFASNNLGTNSTGDLDFLATLKNLSQLKILEFSSNLFGGVLPNSIANLSSLLNQLYLGGNQIYGLIPKTLAKYTNLQLLDMSSNLFTGIIPSDFGMLQNMGLMDLGENRLSGQIPSSFGNLTQLSALYLLENRLNGSIPPSIGNCKSLQYLDISHNSLTGAIPKEVIGLPFLSLLLNLSHNSLTGNLPAQVGNLKNTYALDVSENNLFGEIPTTIGNCEILEYLNLKGNSFQGVIPSTLASLKGLTHLDLSQNNLSGNIPKDLENLHFLLYFNASFNDLEGEMPTKGVFGNVSAISVMGNNRLCGGMIELRLRACPDAKERKRGISHGMKLIIIVTSVVLGLLLPLLLARYWKRNSKKNLPTEALDPLHLSKVSYKMLYDGTGGFSPTNLIGSGSFGSVYKGILNQDEQAVAIKVLNLQQRGASNSFTAECMALKNARHRNLVKILTSCSSIDFHGNDFKALVFKYMENSSLDVWLHLKKDRENDLEKFNILPRLNIAIDVASALHYLHYECEPPIVHCDLKPSNVLLDNDMVAHVGDFGLARILPVTNNIPQTQSGTSGLKGSIGYAAPEYGMGGKASIEGDVYSYGILLLEMFTGKRPTDEVFKEGMNIHQYAMMALPERVMQIVDPSLLLKDIVEVRNAKMERCLQSVIEVGLGCSVEPPKERMKMGEVISKLLLIKNYCLGTATNMSNIRDF